jgi:hypothetical protein
VVLAKHVPLLLPAEHDALAARIICRAGCPAFQVGGFAAARSMHATPDVDLEHYGEKTPPLASTPNSAAPTRPPHFLVSWLPAQPIETLGFVPTGIQAV